MFTKKSSVIKNIFAAAVFLFSLPVFSEEYFSVCEAELPETGWQCELEFPDRVSPVDDTLAMNSLFSFDFFHDQGILFVQVPEAVKDFSLFVNQEKVNAQFSGGKTYAVDFSKLSRNGKNFIQVAQVKSENEREKVKVFVPYPELLLGSASEEGIDEDDFALISEIIQSDVEHGFPSAQLAVSKNGKLIYKNSWGYLNSYDSEGNPLPEEDREKVTDETLFDIASCTKAIAANYALEYLISKKLLSFDDKISDILGKEFYKKTVSIKYTNGVKASLSQNKKWKSELTVRDLASHRAGFPAGPSYYNQNFNSTAQRRERENQKPKNKLYAGSGADVETRKKTYDAVCKTPLMYEPRTRVLYSDADYIILCFVIEKITGLSLDDFCRKTFWEPLDLKRISFNPLENGFEKNDCAATELRGNTRGGTLLDFKGREETVQGQVHDETAWYSMAGVSGHAGLFSNAIDAVKLLNASFYGGIGNNKFFTKDVIDIITAPQRNDIANWGLGWYREGDDRRSWNFSQSASRNTIGHNGWTGTLLMLDPEEKLSLAYFTSKRNTPFNEKNTYEFEGSYFTSANYGFIPYLLYEGSFHGSDSKRARLLLLEEMVHDKFRLVDSEKCSGEKVTDPNHPIVRASYSVLEVFVKRAVKDGSKEALELARNSLNYLLPERDGEEIAKIEAMLKGL